MTLELLLLLLAGIAYGIAMLVAWSFVLHRNGDIFQNAQPILWVGILAHLASLTLRTFATGHAPYSNLYESISAIGLSIAIFGAIALRFSDLRFAVLFTLPLHFLATMYALSLDSSIGPLMPALKSPWLAVHVMTGIIAYGAFAIAFGGAVLVFIRKRWWKDILPSEEKLDELVYRFVIFGFFFQTLLLGTGAIWAEGAWGQYWSFDPKETWALITWLIYIVYLHLRLWKGWRGIPLAALSLLGFASVVFTYFGVGFFLVGFHSYIAQ